MALSVLRGKKTLLRKMGIINCRWEKVQMKGLGIDQLQETSQKNPLKDEPELKFGPRDNLGPKRPVEFCLRLLALVFM